MAIEPVTREERFLAAAGGQSVTPPTPITRKEQLLQGIIDAVKSGGATPDVIDNAVNNYLEANPVKPGATTEQAAQIEQNKTDIADLQTEIDNKQPKGDYVKTVNGNKPDASGNVVVATGGNGSGENLSGADVTSIKTVLGNLMTILKAQVEDSDGTPQGYNMDVSGLVAQNDALIAALGSSGDSGGDTTEKTLTSISATYSGGSVAVGTAVSALTGVVVTAHYSDGSTATVTGYTLSGTIAEGNNTITVTYGGKTATISVVGVSESGGDSDTPDVVNLFDKNTMVVEGKVIDNSNNVLQQATGKMAKIPIVAGTTYAASKTGNVWIAFQVGNVLFVDDSETLVDSFSFGAGAQVTPVEGTYYPPNINGSLAGSKGLTTAYLDTNNRGFTFDAPVGATYMMFTLCWNGGVDSTNTLMFEMGDTCHDYVAYVP